MSYPREGFRIIPSETDLIVERKHELNYTRVCLPHLNESTVEYLTQFCDFYKCNLSKQEFDHQVSVYKEEALDLFESNINANAVNKAYLHRKIRLCNIGLSEDWHSPVFLIKLKSKVMATTGHNKIYATYLRRKKLNLDFECYVLDFDRKPNDIDDFFINVEPIIRDKDFSYHIGSDDFAIDISLEKTLYGYVPCVMQFAKHYPIEYNDRSHELANSNASFFKNNGTAIRIVDTHNSLIHDSSSIFDISDDADMVFTTNTRIKFDLFDLIPFLTHTALSYTDELSTYTLVTNGDDNMLKKSCPATLL